jgi:LAO/AO transport system kinase
MQMHATDPGVFIRSMATRGHLGGLALAAPEAIRVLDASGRDVIVVETVGVGQVEVEVATAADTTIVVVTPGWGDSIQVAKAGIMEIADVFVVNKSDMEGADRAVRDLRTMLEMGPERDWVPPVVATSTLQSSGVSELWEAVTAHREYLEASGELIVRRSARLLSEVEDIVAQTLRERAAASLEATPELIEDLTQRRLDPYAAADLTLRGIPG